MKENKIEIKTEDFDRVNNDVNGNPRYAIHFLSFIPTSKNAGYEDILKLNKKLSLGGRKYHNKQYGGGLVFSSYNLLDLCRFLNEKLNKYYINGGQYE